VSYRRYKLLINYSFLHLSYQWRTQWLHDSVQLTTL